MVKLLLLSSILGVACGCMKRISDDWRGDVKPILTETTSVIVETKETLRHVAENSDILAAKLVDATKTTSNAVWIIVACVLGGHSVWDVLRKKLGL